MSTMTKTSMKTVDASKAKEYFEKKISFTAGPVEVSHWIKEGAPINIVDVRAEEDYDKGHLPGAINLPKDRWDTFKGLEKSKNNLLYCYNHTCHLAAMAAVKFAEKGYPVLEMEGGFETWMEKGFETILDES